MRSIDLEAWPRREHFGLFRNYHQSHFDMCAPVDVTAFRPAVKEAGASLNTAIVYVLGRAANDVAEFRLRIRDDAVVEHDEVHPAPVVMVDGGVFTFAFFEYSEDFAAFSDAVAEATARAREHPSLADPPDRDDLLFMTAIPWVAFTAFSHPIPTAPEDSIPRFAWGKITERDRRLELPLNVQAHHALMDGLHMGRYYERVQDLFADPALYL